jgi:hypothetical protein
MRGFSRRLARLETAVAPPPREALVTLTATQALTLRVAVFLRFGAHGYTAGGLTAGELRDLYDRLRAAGKRQSPNPDIEECCNRLIEAGRHGDPRDSLANAVAELAELRRLLARP